MISLLLLAAHLIGDYIFQTDQQAATHATLKFERFCVIIGEERLRS